MTSIPNAIRTIVHPAMGIFAVYPSGEGFDAFPLDPVRVGREFGVSGFYADDVATLVSRVHAW